METLSAMCTGLYQRERIAMTNLVTTGTLRPIHDFAEAFRFRKGNRRG